MRFKKSILILMMLLVSSIFTGCHIVYTYDMTSPDKVHFITDMYFTEEEIKQVDPKSENEYEVVTLEDGKTYYKLSESKDIPMSEVKSSSSGEVISHDIIFIPLNTVEEQTDETAENYSLDSKSINLALKFSFVFEDEVVDTNCKLSEDKKSISFNAEDIGYEYYYAYTARGKAMMDADKTAPVISGFNENVYYKSSILDKLDVNDNIALKSITCNGNKIVKCEKGWNFPNGGKLRQGKNTIVATDMSGNSSTVTLLIDDKAPIIKNLKNKTFKKSGSKKYVFYVKDKESGLKKIAVSKNNKGYKTVPKKNIKLIKSGKYKGYYKVTLTCKKTCKLGVKVYDKCGNIKTKSGVKIVVRK